MSTLEIIKSKYKEYLDLNYTKSLEDPEERPFDSKYQAREVLTKLRSTLDPSLQHKNEILESYYSLLNDFTQKIYNKSSTLYFIEKLLDFNLAKNFIESEEYENGERILGKLLIELEKLIENEDDKTHSIKNYNPIYFNLLLNCLNELVFVWSYRADYEKCARLLNKAQEIYEFYKNLPKGTESNFQAPFDFNEIIEFNSSLTNEKRELLFESLYTHSLYYMAQIFGKLEEREKSAYYCQLTLQRQLDFNNNNDDYVDNGNIQPQLTPISFDAVEWATHAAALSQFYVCSNDFSTSRHCLYCAEALLAYLNENRSKYDRQYLDKIELQTASIKRCWGKYAIALLKHSKELLLSDTMDTKDLKANYDAPSKFHFSFKNFKSIPDFDKYFNEIENSLNITINLVLDHEQAKKLFLKVQKILQDSTEYFKFDGYVTDHCEIIHDISDLYALLIFYEPNIENKSKMFKRRLDLLKPIVDEISEQFYLILKRQFLFDCAEIYQQMMDIKFELLNEKREQLSKDKTEINAQNKKVISSMIIKINQLAYSSIEYYEKFINTMKSMPDKVKLPEKLDLNNVRPTLLAHFYIGRLYSKIITHDPAETLANTRKSYEYYSYLVQYCEKHQDDAEAQVMDLMKTEYNVCKEMIAFMPVKMENLRKSIK